MINISTIRLSTSVASGISFPFHALLYLHDSNSNATTNEDVSVISITSLLLQVIIPCSNFITDCFYEIIYSLTDPGVVVSFALSTLSVIFLIT